MNPAALNPDARLRVPRILAVDDSELMHRLLRTRLQLEQVEIHCAVTGEDGLRMAEELQPEVILLDIDLDGMDGFEVLQRLKENPRTRDIAVIFISASCETMDRVRCLDLGAVDFIPKPFEMAELKAWACDTLRQRQAAVQPAAFSRWSLHKVSTLGFRSVDGPEEHTVKHLSLHPCLTPAMLN